MEYIQFYRSYILLLFRIMGLQPLLVVEVIRCRIFWLGLAQILVGTIRMLSIISRYGRFGLAGSPLQHIVYCLRMAWFLLGKVHNRNRC